MRIIKPAFTLLEYFYVLLKSVERSAERRDVFELFKVLKHQYGLGESKYKTVTRDRKELTSAQENRYLYTFDRVIDEAREYGLLKETRESLILTPAGVKIIRDFDNQDFDKFHQQLFSLMEKKGAVFRNLIASIYNVQSHPPGLLIFPIYSPRLLNFERAEIKKTSHLIDYSWALVKKLEADLMKHLNFDRQLKKRNDELLVNLTRAGFLSEDPSMPFDPKKYNAINKRIRDYWINYFLRDIYGYSSSWSAFERWVYRGKQIGILHATEFLPHFHGKIVYPTSVVIEKTLSSDFREIYAYRDGMKLFVHRPSWDRIQNKFVKSLVDGYFDLRRSNQSYFISLTSLRELVCFKLKISERLFESYLERAYRLNLANRLAVRISLEVDKLPEETKAAYLTREPVMVDGRHRNIIAIDVTKGVNR
ncbi:MAG TPA: hypothetical protein VGD61_16780 [Pyrinomonadaceae bacterium]